MFMQVRGLNALATTAANVWLYLNVHAVRSKREEKAGTLWPASSHQHAKRQITPSIRRCRKGKRATGLQGARRKRQLHACNDQAASRLKRSATA